MKSRLWYTALTIVIAASFILSACTPQATPTTAPEPPQAPTQAGAAPTTAPAAPTAAPAAPAAAPTDVPAAAGPETGGRITVMDAGGFYTLDPYQTPWFTLTQSAVYDTLVTPNLELTGYVGILAKSWVVAPDGLSLTFTLRDDVKFQDGTPFDSAAAKWNLEKYLDPDWPHAINGAWVDAISGFETPDKTTLVIKFKTPYAPIFSDLNMTYIVSPTQYEKLGKDNFGREPIGTGPWIAKEIVENDHVLYVRNPDYKWGPSFYENKGAGYPDELYLKFITDQAVNYASLETGEATLIGLPAQYLKQAEGNKDIQITKGIDWSDWYLGFNNSKAPFDQKDFRKAIAYAINRDEIIQAAFEGEAFALYSSLAPSTWGYKDSQNEYGMAADTYDPEKAKELLAGLGYTDTNGDNVLEKDGKPLSLKFNFPAGDDTKRAAETIQAQLAEVGIKSELGPMEAAAISSMLQKCEQQLFLRPFGLADASILSSVFNSARMGASNRNCWENDETDKLITAADTTMDPAKRAEAVDALVKQLVDERPHLPLWASYLYTASRVELQGLKYDKAGNYYLLDSYLAK